MYATDGPSTQVPSARPFTLAHCNFVSQLAVSDIMPCSRARSERDIGRTARTRLHSNDVLDLLPPWRVSVVVLVSSNRHFRIAWQRGRRYLRPKDDDAKGGVNDEMARLGIMQCS